MKKGDQIKIKRDGRVYDAVVETPADGKQPLIVVLNSGEYVSNPEIVQDKKSAPAANQ